MFAPDTRLALQAATALVNTGRRRDGRDALADVEQLDEFYAEWGYTGRHDQDDAEAALVRDVRERLAQFWAADRDAAAGLLNAMLAESGALPFLVRHDGWDWHLHAVPLDAPLPVRILVEAAMAMLDVVRSDEWDRLRVCSADDCRAVLVDLSRNRSRLFCDVNGCANRAHVEAYRARRAGEPD